MKYISIFRLWLTGLSLVVASAVCAQQGGWQISGTVTGAPDNNPVPFATVVAISQFSGKPIAGTTTEENGQFEFHTDSSGVRIEIRSMGFLTLQLDSIPFTSPVINLGQIVLRSEVQEITEVEVTAERSTLEFKLDKRVFNVGKDISSTGMGALELLNNVPSVNVDIQGNITLRGNSGVQILIDGKPSVLSDDPTKALGTLTADMIESVEVITNPSAKYEAGGTSGIINIVLKKEEKKGINGSLSVNTGIPNNHSVGGSLNYRTGKFNFFTQLGGGYRTYPEFSKTENRSVGDLTSASSVGKALKNEQFYNITIGADYFLNKYNTLTLSGNYAYELEDNPSASTFRVTDSLGNLVSDYDRQETTSATNPKWQYDLQYKKQFKNHKDHVLQFSTQGTFFGKDQQSTYRNTYYNGSGVPADQRTTTDFYQADYTFKLDYVNPVIKHITMEWGSLYEINDVGNNYAVYNGQAADWILNTNLTNDFRYNQKVFGVYGTGAYEGAKWGVKVGLRAENTDLHTRLVTTGTTNSRNYTNLFPSLHTSYKFTRRFSVQAGYSRRIFRPRLWDLNPFYNVQNNYNIRTGNPDLLPEFGDSYELTGILVYDKISLNAGIYHLYTTDVMESVAYYSNGVTISTRANAGTNHKTGIELNGKYTPLKWMSLTADFNYGYFNRQGSFNNRSFDFRGEQWSARSTIKLKLPAKTDLELTPSYQSSYKTVLGTVSGFLTIDAGVRKKILKDKAVINFSVRDIFASRIMETIIVQPDYSVYSFGKRGRFLTLGFSYSFGKGEVMTYSGGKGGR